MGEGIGTNKLKEDELRKIVKGLNEGSDIKKVKKEFDKLIRDISPEEIANVEQALIDEGVPVEHVQKLCDIHVQVFDDALKKQGKTKVLPGHPIHTYRLENRELRRKLRSLKPGKSDFISYLKDVKLIELHYIRKENQLFPYLESVGFTGPSKVMWGKHDEIRTLFREIEEDYNKGNLSEIKKKTRALIKALKNMIFMEEKILFPTSLRKLPSQAWSAIRKGENAIGYSWIEPGNLWDANIVSARNTDAESIAPDSDTRGTGNEKIPLDTGSLTAFQINLLLKNLPFDMTFVDENDKVAYYSEGKERIFPRSPGIIGRDVANCHPPKSVHVVEKIVEALKKGEKDQAEFWIQMNGKFIHIRYFPLFDMLGKYRGIIEVSQEISGIRALEGERRLLDW